MLDKKEIYEAFKAFALASESERHRVLLQGVAQTKKEHKAVNYIVIDNVTTMSKGEGSKDAKLE